MNRQETYTVIREYLKQYPIDQIGIFGSFSRGEEKPTSDIDILVSFTESIDLITFSKMHRELSELLQRRVEIVSKEYLHPRLKKSIEKDLRLLPTS